MSKLIDLTGKTFGRLTVVERDFNTKRRDASWLCKCNCGNEKLISVMAYNLKSDHTQSCGCLHKEKISEKQKKYNMYDLTQNIGIGYTVNGGEFYFDLDDYEKILPYTWRTKEDGYIVSTYGERFHRLVFGAKEDEVIDHIDRCKNNNVKINLRIATHQQNGFNINKPSTNKSGIIGVFWHKVTGKWCSRIKHDDIDYYLGVHSDKEEAIKIRLKAELKYFGLEFAPQRHLFEQYGIRHEMTEINMN